MTFSSNPQSEIPNPQLLRLFIYGTLKRGFWNHDRFCRGVLAVEEGMVRGRIFETPSGIPFLEVPEEDVIAIGTTNPLADVATCLRADTHRQAQAHVTARLFNPQSTIINPQYEGAPWGPVHGELLTFDLPAPRLRQAGDPVIRLPAIDRLEGFHPLSACGHAQAGGGSCLYRRVLVPVRTKETVLPAWLYMVGDRWTGGCKELTGGIWR